MLQHTYRPLHRPPNQPPLAQQALDWCLEFVLVADLRYLGKTNLQSVNPLSTGRNGPPICAPCHNAVMQREFDPQPAATPFPEKALPHLLNLEGASEDRCLEP